MKISILYCLLWILRSTISSRCGYPCPFPTKFTVGRSAPDTVSVGVAMQAGRCRVFIRVWISPRGPSEMISATRRLRRHAANLPIDPDDRVDELLYFGLLSICYLPNMVEYQTATRFRSRKFVELVVMSTDLLPSLFHAVFVGPEDVEEVVFNLRIFRIHLATSHISSASPQRNTKHMSESLPPPPIT